MDGINKELTLIRDEVASDFFEPFESCDLKEFLLGSSKMIRSQLAIFYLKTFNAEISIPLLKILAAGEIIHNASLLHDDILDNAKTRRGVLTIGEKYSDKASILAGDYLLSFAIKKLLEVNNEKILSLFRECTEKMTVSEIKQLQLRDKKTSFEDYIDICKNKTGLLFSTILEACALIVGLDSNLAKELGLLFGIVFQIKNDLEETSAKQDKLNKIETVIDILGVEKTKDLLDNYHEEMKILLDKIPNNEYKIRLEDLINKYVR